MENYKNLVRYIVKTDTDLNIDILRREYYIRQIAPTLYVVVGTELDRVQLESLKGIIYVEKDQSTLTFDGSVGTLPSLPWNLQMLDLKGAFKLTKGKGIKVAIIDTGIDYTHKDLGGMGIEITANDAPVVVKDKLAAELDRVRLGEHPVIFKGWNFVDDTDFAYDDHRHGTSVSGVIVAQENDFGIGVASESQIIPYKILDANAMGFLSDTIPALYRAIEDKVDIVSLSIAYNHPSFGLQEAIDMCNKNNVLIVAASGNNNNELEMYPGAYNGVLSVGGVINSAKRWSSGSLGSNYGSYLDMVAPCGPMSILLAMRSRHDIHIGTSLASPAVAGIAALCKSIYKDISINDLRNILIASTSNEVWDKEIGWGIVNARRAVELTQRLRDHHLADVNKDGFVDILDLSFVASKLGDPFLKDRYKENYYEK